MGVGGHDRREVQPADVRLVPALWVESLEAAQEPIPHRSAHLEESRSR